MDIVKVIHVFVSYYMANTEYITWNHIKPIVLFFQFCGYLHLWSISINSKSYQKPSSVIQTFFFSNILYHMCIAEKLRSNDAHKGLKECWQCQVWAEEFCDWWHSSSQDFVIDTVNSMKLLVKSFRYQNNSCTSIRIKPKIMRDHQNSHKFFGHCITFKP